MASAKSTMPAPRKRLAPNLRRTMILDAAAAVFAERGYEAGSIDEIGARMGISGPAIYRHFARKQDIVVELLVRAVAEAVAELDNGTSRPAELETLVAGLAKRAAAEQATLALLHTHLPALDLANRSRIAETRDRLLDRWSKELRRHRPSLAESDCRTRVVACFAIVGSLSATKASPDTIEQLLLALLLA